MNWDAIGAVGEIVGAVAVLVTLLYLSRQIRQNTHAMRSQAAHETFHLSFEEVALFTRDGNPEAWSKFRADGWKALTPAEQVTVGAIAITLFTTYDSHYHSFLEGTLDNEIHVSYTVRLSRQLMVPSIREWWKHNRVQFTESFKTHVDKLVQEVEGDA